MPKRNSKFISKYEKLLFPIIENSIQKLIASIILYETKSAYTSAYFLTIIAQEELAKLILIPIAKEIGKLDDLLKNRKDGFFSHKVKQKVFSTYAFFERQWKDIENIKQNCLYTSVDAEGKMKYCTISKGECYKEIKNALFVYQYQMKIIADEQSFTKNFKKSALFMTQLLGGCLQEKVPSLVKDFFKDADKAVKVIESNKNKAESELLKSLFKNPYRMIEITKYALGKNYKEFLKEIRNMSFGDMVQHLGKKLSEIDSES